MSWVLIGIIALVIVAAYVWYAVIVMRRNRVSEALAGIDVQLQQRHDLIPNVLTIARRFMDYEHPGPNLPRIPATRRRSGGSEKRTTHRLC